MKKRRTAKAKRVMAGSNCQRRFFSAASFMTLIASAQCFISATRFGAVILPEIPFLVLWQGETPRNAE